jgi:hypothetical protein
VSQALIGVRFKNRGLFSTAEYTYLLYVKMTFLYTHICIYCMLIVSVFLFVAVQKLSILWSIDILLRTSVSAEEIDFCLSSKNSFAWVQTRMLQASFEDQSIIHLQSERIKNWRVFLHDIYKAMNLKKNLSVTTWFSNSSTQDVFLKSCVDIPICNTYDISLN